MRRWERSIVYRRWLLVFSLSFLIGIILMNLGNNIFLKEEGIFHVASINRLKYVEIESKRFFQYVLRQRMWEYLLLGMISATFLGIIAIYFSIAWQGLLLGMFVTAAFVRFGTRGFLLLIGGFFPHQFLFIPAKIMLLEWCYRNKKGQIGKHLLTFIWIIVVVIMGCLLESYVNPMLLSDILKIF